MSDLEKKPTEKEKREEEEVRKMMIDKFNWVKDWDDLDLEEKEKKMEEMLKDDDVSKLLEKVITENKDDFKTDKQIEDIAKIAEYFLNTRITLNDIETDPGTRGLLLIILAGMKLSQEKKSNSTGGRRRRRKSRRKRRKSRKSRKSRKRKTKKRRRRRR